MNYAQKLEAFERKLLEEVLGEHEWNICHAAAALGIHPNTLRNRINRLSVRFPEEHTRRSAKFASAQRRAMTRRGDVCTARAKG